MPAVAEPAITKTSAGRDASSAVHSDTKGESAQGQDFASAVASRATEFPSVAVRWTRGSVLGAGRQDILRVIVLRRGWVMATVLVA